MNNISKREIISLNFMKKKYLENLKKREKNTEHRLLCKERMEAIEKIKEYDRNKLMKNIIKKNEKIELFKYKKLKIYENKRQFQHELQKQKENYTNEFQKIFNKKNIDNIFMKKLKKIFPNNNKIDSLFNSMRQTNFSFNNNKYLNKSQNNFKTSINFNVKLMKSKSNLENKFFSSRKDKKNLSDYINYNNYDDFKNYFNNNSINNEIYSSDNKKNEDNSKSLNFTYEKMNKTFESKKNNEKIINQKLNIENEIQKKINDYKNELNIDLLTLLKKEKKSEEIREQTLAKIKSEKERENLEKEFRIERGQANERIEEKNKEIKNKLKIYEENLKKNNL